MLNQFSQAATRAVVGIGRTVTTVGRIGTALGGTILGGFRLMISGLNRAGRAFYQAAIQVGHIGYENGAWAIYQTTQYTMSKEWMQKPYERTSKSWGRRLADLALFPMTTLPGWFSGVLLLPTVIHSYHSFLSFVQSPLEFLWADLAAEKPRTPKLSGFIYGIFGAMLGLIAGSLVAAVVLVGRIFNHTKEMTGAILTRLINQSVQDVEPANTLVSKLTMRLAPFPQTTFGKVLGIFPLGLPITVFTGSIILVLIGTGRFVLNTLVSLRRNTATGINLSVYDRFIDDQKTEHEKPIKLNPDNRNKVQRILFGGIGEIIGLGVGVAAFLIIVIGRVLLNSAESFARLMFPNTQILLKDGSGLRALFHLPEDKRNEPKSGFSKQLGYPGRYGLGLVAITLGILTGALLRFCHETFISAVHAGIKSLNLALKDLNDYTPIKIDTNRQPIDNVIGFIGYPLGAGLLLPVTTAIVLSRFVITNLNKAWKVAHFFIKNKSSLHGRIEIQAVAPEETEQTQPNTAIEAIDVMPEKTLFQRFYHWIQDVSMRDGDPIFIQALGLPGILIGTLVGGGIRTIIETSQNSIDTASRIINLTLIGSPYQDYIQKIKPNRNTLEVVLGSPGYVIGFCLALIPVVSIGIIRWIITNGDTANRVFVATINQTRRNEEHLPILREDFRPKIIQYSTFPGAGIGLFLGLSRELGLNTMTSLRRPVLNLAKEALIQSGYEHNIQNLVDDNRLLTQKFLGAPGLFFGGLIGAVGYMSISLGRLVGNTALTTYHTIRDMIDFVYLDDYPNADTFTESRRIATYLSAGTGAETDDENVVTIELNTIAVPVAEPVTDISVTSARREDTRQDYPFLLGFPGFILGGALGVLSAGIAGFVRITVQSMITAYDTILDFADTILPANMATTAYRSVERKPIPKLLGYPFGKMFGALLGTVTWLLIFTGRTIYSSGYTAWLVAQAMTWAPPISEERPKLNDPRDVETFDHRIGLLGFVIGVPFGLIGFAINFILHTIAHSARTAYRAFFYISSWSIGSSPLLFGVKKTEFDGQFRKDKRTPFEYYGFGALGFVGVALGLATAGVILAFRFILLNIRMLNIGFKRSANLTLEKPYSKASMRLDHTRNIIQLHKEITLTHDQLDALKYVVGISGLTSGMLLGSTLVALPVAITHGLKESAKSYYHLSQSLLNVGLEAPYFENGIASDERPIQLKIAGGLGYFAAVLTTGWVPAISLMGKGLLVAVALGFSPLVAFIKTVYILNGPRFKTLSQDVQEKPEETKMRALYSALVDGEFPEDAQIEKPSHPATGGKGIWDFVRKSAQFNLNTLTEDVLQAKLDKIRSADGASDLEPVAKERIKQNHRGFFFFTKAMRQQHDATIDQEIQRIDTLVDEYLAESQSVTVEPKKNKPASTAQLFYYRTPDRSGSVYRESALNQ